MNTETAATNDLHHLTCTGPRILPGVRMERTWACSCGATFFGYDSHARRWFKTHQWSR